MKGPGRTERESLPPPTVAEALILGEGVLRREGIEFPRRNAESLLAAILGLDPPELFLHHHRSIAPRPAARLRSLLSRRARQEPLAYLLGEVGFYNLVLKIDPRALIPRPETELLVGLSLMKIQAQRKENPRVLDLGCGCGNIGLALAREHAGIELCASDISAAAVSLARENARDLGIAAIFRTGDLLTPWEDYRPGGFDLMVCNPPYVSREELKTLSLEVKGYEPALALDGGPDGLDIIRRVIEESPDYISPGGWLSLEVGSKQSCQVKKLMTGRGEFGSPEILRDYNGHERVVAARRG